MNGKLREWEPDAFGVEAFIDNSVQVVIYVPIVCALDPNPYHEINATIGQLAHSHKGFGRFVQNAFILGDDVIQYMLDVREVASVLHTEGPFYTTDGLIAIINYYATT